MHRRIGSLIAVLPLALATAGLPGCSQSDDDTSLDEAMEEVTDEVEDAADEVEDEIDDRT